MAQTNFAKASQRSVNRSLRKLDRQVIKETDRTEKQATAAGADAGRDASPVDTGTLRSSWVSTAEKVINTSRAASFVSGLVRAVKLAMRRTVNRKGRQNINRAVRKTGKRG